MHNALFAKGYRFTGIFFFGRWGLVAWGLLFLLPGAELSAQAEEENSPDTAAYQPPSPRLFALPLLFYGPETRLGFGAAGAMAFSFRNALPTDRPSQLQIGLAYTLNNQFLVYLPYQLFTRDERWIFSGELGFYRYFYYYYGIGNEAWQQERETYEVTFPRLRFRGVYRFSGKNFLGIQYAFDDFRNLSFPEGGILATTSPTGLNGGPISGSGPVFVHDSRNNVFAPWKGYYLEAGATFHSPVLGSAYTYQKYTLDARTYLVGTPRHTLAAQLYAEFTGGNPPFYQLALLGGSQLMRGIVEGRLRDNHYVMAQAEWRQHLFWRIGMTAFLAYGGVAPTLDGFQLSQFRLVGGLGIRVLLLEDDRINVRIDYGFGKETSGFYLTVSEAF